MSDHVKVWERRFETPMLIAALLVIPVIIIEENEPGQLWSDIAVTLNSIAWLAFAIELVVMTRGLLHG